MRSNHKTGRRESFEPFYLRHVAISEGCGCSELVIRDRDPKLRPLGLWPWLKARFRRSLEDKSS